MSGLARFLALLSLFLAGFALRCADYRRILGGPEVFFPDNDPYYHMRRILMTMEDYPHVPLFDSMMNYPHGAFIIWPPLFDFTLATLCLALGLSAGDIQGAAAVSSVSIPAMGALTAIAVYYLAKETVGERYSLAAGGAFILFPVHIWYSKLGFVDHHAAVTLAQTVMFALFMRLINLQRAAEHGGRRWALLTGAALSIAGGTLVWHGYIFFVAVLDAFLLAALIAEWGKKDSRLPELCYLTHLPAALLILPFSIQAALASGKPFTAIMISMFHPMAVSAMGIIGAVALLIKTRPWLIKPAGILALAAAAGLVQAGALSEGMGWIMTSDPFMASVLESTSFFTERGQFSLYGAFYMLTLLFPLVILGAAAMLAGQFKSGFSDYGRAFIAALTLLFFAMLAKQRRFGADFGPAHAVIAGYLAVTLFDRLKTPRFTLIPGLAVTAVILASSAHFHYAHTIRPLMAETNPDPDHYARKNLFLYKLREIVKRDGGYGKDGAMAFWDMGHKILYIAGLGAVSNNFGLHIGEESYRDWCAFFMAESLAEGDKILQRRNIRYVVADHDMGAFYSAMLYMGKKETDYFERKPGAVSAKPSYAGTLFARFSSPATEPGWRVKAPEGFRLILDSKRGDQPGYPKAWERVKGASVRLRGEPLSTVKISYDYVSNAGRRIFYAQEIALDAEGRGEFNAPYSSDRPDLGHTSRYRIERPGGASELYVQEKDVLSGASLETD